MKKAIIIHGWGGSPDEAWMPWLKNQLEQAGVEVTAPAMPDADEPVMEKWIPVVQKLLSTDPENTIAIGHSIGNQTILRALEKLPAGQKIKTALFVAPWFTLKGLEDEEWPIANPWINTPIDLKNVENRFIHQPTAIFSDNDPVVPLDENQQKYKNEIGAHTIIEHNKGHISGGDNISDLPSAWNALSAIV